MDILIQDALVLTPGYRAEPHSLYLSGGAIAGIDRAPQGFSAQRVISGKNRLVMPGMVNCHTHLYMTLFRNYADDLPFEKWLFERLMPREDAMTPEDAYWCNLLGCLEMIQTGTTTFLDMHMFRNQCINAAAEAGLRAVMSRGIVGDGPDDDGARSRMGDTFAELELADASDGLLHCMLAPHAIYTCGEPLLKHLADVAKGRGLRVHIHVSETQNEYDSCLREHGCTPVEYLARCGLFDVPAVAAHCVWLTDNDIAILAEKGVSVASCPYSNMKLGNGFAPVPKLLAAGVNVVLGTDGAASNNTLNLFREMAALCTVHKGVQRDPEAVTALQGLQAATAGGARALGLEGSIGSIAVGKRADLILIDLDRPQLRPHNDVVTALAYSASGYEVDTVLVDGELLMDGGRVTTIDAERVYFEVERIRQRLL